MPRIVLFSDRNYFLLNRLVSARSNQRKIFLMSWKQRQSRNFLYFAFKFPKTRYSFQSFWREWKRARGRGHPYWRCSSYCGRAEECSIQQQWRVFRQNHYATVDVWSLDKRVSCTYLLLWLILWVTIMGATHRYLNW